MNNLSNSPLARSHPKSDRSFVRVDMYEQLAATLRTRRNRRDRRILHDKPIGVINSSSPKSRTKKVFYGWWVSLAGAANMFVSSGPTFQAASTLFRAIEDEFGWSRAIVTGVASFGRFGGALLGPIEGWMTDKFGTGKMVLLGFTLGGFGLIFYSQLQGPVQDYFISMRSPSSLHIRQESSSIRRPRR